MRFTYMVEVEVTRDEGKFASRDEIGSQIMEALEAADYGSWSGDEGGQYSTADFTVTEQEQPKRKRRRA